MAKGKQTGSQYDLELSNSELMEKLDIEEEEVILLNMDYLRIQYKTQKDVNGKELLVVNKVDVIYGTLVDRIVNSEVIIPDLDPIVFKLFGNKDSEIPYIYMYDKGVYVKVSVRYLRDYIRKCFPTIIYKSAYADEVIRQIMDRSDIYCDMLELDNEKFEHYIVFNNGLLNTKTWKLEPHNENVMLTTKFDMDFPTLESTKDKNKGIFDKYLDDLCTYYDEDIALIDSDVRNLILEAVGLVFSNYPGFYTKSCILMKGAKDTGKTQIKNLIAEIIGVEKTSGLELKALNEARFVASEIYGKRLIGSNDMQYSSSDDMGAFKKLTGNDFMTIEFKNRDPFSYKFRGYVWFLSNEFPPIGGNKGNEVYERFLLIPCDNPIPKDKQDTGLLRKMLEEKEYIVALTLEHLKYLMARGFKFKQSDRMLEANKQYEASNNTLLQFIEECCIIDNDIKGCDKVKRSDFKTYYSRWCRESNIKKPIAIKKSTFDYLEKTLGTEKVVYNGYPCLSNIRMNMDEDSWQVDVGFNK